MPFTRVRYELSYRNTVAVKCDDGPVSGWQGFVNPEKSVNDIASV